MLLDLIFPMVIMQNIAFALTMVRAAAAKVNKPVAILLDTKGPEMRLGNFVEGKVTIEQGQKFIITSRDVEGTKEICSVNHRHCHKK